MNSARLHIAKAIFVIGLFIFPNIFFSQTDPFTSEEKLHWADNKPVTLPPGYDAFSAYDLVILSEQTEFEFYTNASGKLIRNMLVKINTDKGLEKFRTLQLPESFDNAYDAYRVQQGRRSKIKVPFMQTYTVKQFMARAFSRGRWAEVPFKNEFVPARWVAPTGRFMDDDISCYQLKNIAVGDIMQIYYESKFEGKYGSNIFYFNSAYPKLASEYKFTYRVPFFLSGSAHLFPVMIQDSCIRRSRTAGKDFNVHTDWFTLKNLKPVNYPANSFEGRVLPHVCIDLSSHLVTKGSNPTETGRSYDYARVKPVNFEWMVFVDTNNYYTKIYDKHSAVMRKFLSTFPPLGSDSSNFVFFKAVCDTFNNFRYITMNHLFYNEQALYDVSSADHLMKRRLTGSTWNLYKDILDENKIFYYLINVQDKRYGEHSRQFRAHDAYERSILAIPYKDTYIYFIPRPDGLKYHLNELPFYYEGVLGALMPRNFQADTKNKEDSYFKYVKTHKGTYNENTRTENATVKISTDSLTAGFSIKESLSGQFSTVLRHLYLNEYIDSTIAPYYFKKCTAKPKAYDVKIKLSSKITDYPFRYTFNCTEKVPLLHAQTLDLKNWFSFTLSKNSIPEIPTHDYYFDFEFSDSYNFLLNFNSAVELKNAQAFTRNINSDLFELESAIVKNSESSYLLKVRVAVKQAKIPQEQLGEMMELVKALDELNGFLLEFEKK